MASPDNKRVAKNAIALTLRMVLVTIVGLYTSRVVLEALGVDDYGIYGVVGGIVGMASFLNSSMAGATSRFITFELGKGNDEKLKCIFSTALIIHFIIALVVVVLAETIGLWFLNNKMVIPADRMLAANVLYQFSVLSVIVGFTQVPYAADIMAHEKMRIYAYFEIINVVLKLVIVYLLLIVHSDRLIFYAGLTFAVSVLSAMFYRWYCISHFKEAHFSTAFNKQTAKEMLTFSGYDLYGNMCVVAQTQGEPIVLNLFFGVVANAASSIAQTVTGVIRALVSNVMVAFRPQIIKQYASNEVGAMAKLMRRSTQFTLFSLGVIVVPFILETPEILYLWLGQIPEYSVTFIRIILLGSLFHVVVQNNNIAVHATGNIKRISFINGTIFLSSPIISYLLLKFTECSASVIYIMNVVTMSTNMIIGFFIIKNQITEFPILRYSWGVIKSLLAIATSFAVTCIISRKLMLNDNLSVDIIHILIQCTIVTLLNFITIFVVYYVLALDAQDRNYINSRIVKILCANKGK